MPFRCQVDRPRRLEGIVFFAAPGFGCKLTGELCDRCSTRSIVAVTKRCSESGSEGIVRWSPSRFAGSRERVYCSLGFFKGFGSEFSDHISRSFPTLMVGVSRPSFAPQRR